MSESRSDSRGAGEATSGYFQSRFVPEAARAGAWRVICRHLERFIPAEARVLDLGAGFAALADPDVKTHVGSCTDLSSFPSRHFDVVFASNLLESRLPAWPWLVRLYPASPWRPRAGQMLVVGRAGAGGSADGSQTARGEAVHVGG